MTQKTVKLKNVGNEPLAFAGVPMIHPNDTIEVSSEEAEILLKNESLKMVEDKKSEKSFKAVEAE